MDGRNRRLEAAWRPARSKSPAIPQGRRAFFRIFSKAAGSALVRTRQIKFAGALLTNARLLARRTMRAISLRETGQAAGPPHRGGPCSHPANSICRGPSSQPPPLPRRTMRAISLRETGQAASPPHCADVAFRGQWFLAPTRLRRPGGYRLVKMGATRTAPQWAGHRRWQGFAA